MPTAHVAVDIQNPGGGEQIRVEWVVNGMVVSSSDYWNWQGITRVEQDVPENSTVRVDVGAVANDGQVAWASSNDLSVGSAPPPPPNPPPTPPMLGQLTLMYWNP